jgi:hypothetical protein
MQAPFARLQTALGVSATALLSVPALLSAAPATAQTVATPATPAAASAAVTPPKHKAHRHKVPNLEMDVDGTGGEAAETAGPTTTSENALAPNELNSSSAAASFVQAPPPPEPLQAPGVTPASSDNATPQR